MSGEWFRRTNMQPGLPCRRIVVLVFLCLWLLGCNRGQSQAPVIKPAAVRVAHPVVKEITDYEEITGRTESKQSVDLKARVTGYLQWDYLNPGNNKTTIGCTALIAASTPLLQVELAPLLTKGAYPQLKLGTREGTLVNEGDLLFLIDPRTYQAEFNKADAMVSQAKAKRIRLAKDYERAVKLHKQNSMSDQEFDM